MAFYAPAGATPADISAAITAATGPLETLTVSGGPISTYTFSNLQGALEVRFELRWVKGSLSTSALLIRPNGIASQQLTDYTQGDGGGGPGDLSIAGLALCVCNRGPGATASIKLHLDTGGQRVGGGTFGGGGDSTTPTALRTCHAYLLWEDTSTVVESLTVDCVDSGTLLSSSDLLDGTVISVFKVR